MRRPLAYPPFIACKLLIGGVLCLPLLAGCESSSTSDIADAPAPPTAEERFGRIVRILEDRIEGGSLGVADVVSEYEAPVGTPVTDATIRVDHELIPPASDDEPYRGEVCLTSTSKVTVVLPTPTEEEREAATKKRSAEVAQLESELEGVVDLDSLVVPDTDGLAGRLGSSPIHEISPGETQRCYEFEFRDGKWVLLTELDRENEPFYAIAIEYALRKQ
ncbi:MAG: hypothetical protein AAF266_00165 [Planctomycetota bacterium]